jgi:hypothetical protein
VAREACTYISVVTLPPGFAALTVFAVSGRLPNQLAPPMRLVHGDPPTVLREGAKATTLPPELRGRIVFLPPSLPLLSSPEIGDPTDGNGNRSSKPNAGGTTTPAAKTKGTT